MIVCKKPNNDPYYNMNVDINSQLPIISIPIKSNNENLLGVI